MRHIYKKIAVLALVLAPFTVTAQSVDTSAIAAQIAALQAQLASLQQTRTTAETASTQGSSDGHCVTLEHTVARGDSGPDVLAIQKFLVEENLLDEENASGFFGPLTEAALKQWQSAHSLDPVGYAGPRTRAAIADCGGSGGPTLVSNQCPTVQKPAVCANAVSVVSNGCTVGWQCSVTTMPAQTFTASPRSGPVPLVVRFAGVVTSENDGFCEGNFCAGTLVFGDGTTGAVPLPSAQNSALTYEITHTYRSGGNFVANLYQGAAGTGSFVGNGIAITATAPVIATTTPVINVNPNYGNAPLAVTVTVGNVTSPANLSIEFGDGSFASLQQIGSTWGATHTYITTGTFTVKLRRVNNAGDTCTSSTCQVLASNTVSVTGTQIASAALVATPATGLAPLAVSFFTNGASVAYTGGVVLDFGDNTTEFVCAANIFCGQKTSTHTYNAAGTYTVQLLGLSGSGSSVLRTTTVTASALTATTLTATPTSGPVPLAVTFTGTGGNQAYPNGVIMKYGDDSTETFCNANELCGQKTKTHTYVDGSLYSAQLIGLGTGSASTTLGSVAITATGGPTKVKVTAPTGSARKGETVPLSWTIRGVKPTSGSISFDLYTNAGVRIGTILTITNFVSGTASWKIPSSADTTCTSTQPNGLCGTKLAPGIYRIQAYVSGANVSETSSEATIEIKDEIIAPSGFTISVTPSTAEIGKSMSIKYRVANPPFGGATALWLVKPSGEPVGLIAGKLDADTELTTYPWTAGQINFCPQALFNTSIACQQPLGSIPAGNYHILAKVYTPFAGNFLDAASGVQFHAVATSTPFALKERGTGASCIVLNNNLAPNDTDATTGGDVTRLQQFLAEDSEIYPEGSVTGFYGNATRRAVERYQAARGIATSGSPETNGYGAVGPTTRASIAGNCSGNSDYLFRATPKTGRAPLAIAFSAKLPVSGGSYNVDFGDGTSATITIPVCPATATCSSVHNATTTHTYSTTGTYIAKLIQTTATCTQDVCTNQSQKIVGTVSVVVTNTTTPPPQTCAAITRTLSAENTDAQTGGDVSRLQQFLAADSILYPEGLVTGFYGPATGRAVARYQESKGISQTGSVGPQTLASIRCTTDNPTNEVFSATPLSGPSPLLVRFATNKQVTTGSYRVDFGDGATQWLSGSSTTHTYAAAGAYTAQLVQSVGNCFGLNGAALALCEIGNTQVLGTKTINAATPATMTLGVSPASVARGANLAISWTSNSAPSGSKVRLEVYRDGTTEPDASSGNGQGLMSGTSELPATGSFNWTVPTESTILADSGYGGYVMAPGTYHIVAKLYSGSTCWGFCLGAQERSIHAIARSGSFNVTAAGTTSGGTGGAFTGEIRCVDAKELKGMMVRITFADNSTRDYEFADTGSIFADFPARPTSMQGFYAGIGYYSAGLGEKWVAANTSITQVTGGSMTGLFRQNQGGISFGDQPSCVITWH